MRVLVTGHRGYIGSVMCKLLKEQGHTVIGIDNSPFQGDPSIDMGLMCNASHPIVADIVKENEIDHIFHLAASVDVGESVKNPALYYWNNVGETAKLLENLSKIEWKGKFIFSSTAAVYEPRFHRAIWEDDPILPANPYGESKLACENVIRHACSAYGINAVVFRFFNVAGAYGDLGDHLNSPHLIPSICRAALNNEVFAINGTDYDTADGTCIRDYVHVLDICRAHLAVSDWLAANPGYHTFNLGSGLGFSVKDIVSAFEYITMKDIAVKPMPRRPGDPAGLYASNRKFIDAVGFEYRHTMVSEIVQSQWLAYQNTC